MPSLSRLVGTLAILQVACGVSGIAANLQVRTVVLSGDAAPVASAELTFSHRFGWEPSINNRGDVTFRAELVGPSVDDSNRNIQLLSTAANELVVVAREGDRIAGLGGDAVLSSLQHPILNIDGHTAINAVLSGDDVDDQNDTAILANTVDVELQVILREGVDTMVAGAIVQFVDLENATASIADNGQVVFRSVFAPPAAPDDRSYAILRHEPGGELSVLALAGDDAPTLGPDIVFSSFKRPIINAGGQVLIQANLTGSGVDASNNRAFYVQQGGEFRLVARAGDRLPGAISNTRFTPFDLSSPWNSSAFSDEGTVAFFAELSGVGVGANNRYAILGETDDGQLRLIARTGDSVPQSNDTAQFFFFKNVSVNAQNRVAFLSQLSDEENNSGLDGLFRETEDAGIELVLRSGDIPPVGDPTAVVKGFRGGYAFNNRGQMAFLATYSTAAVTQTEGLFALDVDGQLRSVARVGDLINVSDNPSESDWRTISYFFTEFGLADDRRSILNDAGQIVFHAAFTDGSAGIFVSDLVTSLPGDYNADGQVTLADYTLWRDTLGATGAGLAADGNGDLVVDAHDYDLWKAGFGQSTLPGSSAAMAVPEPGAWWSLVAVVVLVLWWHMAMRGNPGGVFSK